jgi:hypothetical protein
MKLRTKYFILLSFVLQVFGFANNNLDSLFLVAKEMLLQQIKINNKNDKEGRPTENKYVVVIDGNSVNFQASNYVNSAGQYIVESGASTTILTPTEINSAQGKLSDFHTRRIGKDVKVKFYSVIINDFKFYVNKSLVNVDTGAIYIDKLGTYIKNEKFKNLNDQTKRKIKFFQEKIWSEVSALNPADTNFILYTFCKLSAVDAINGQTQVRTFFRDYLGFFGNPNLGRHAKYIRKESANGISSTSNQRIAQVIDNVINAVEVYIDGGFVPLPESYCGTSFESILTDTRASRKLLFNNEVASFKKFINANATTNDIHFDRIMAPEKEQDILINDILKERLTALKGNSQYKITFYFKEIPFVMDSDSIKLFAQKCVEGSSLDDGNNIVIVIPYFARKCEGNLYYWKMTSYRGIPMPAVFCNNATVKNNIETVLSGSGDLKTRLNNLFIHVPKKQHIIYAFINYEGNLIINASLSPTETTGETNVYAFKFYTDKRAYKLAVNFAGCQVTPPSTGYTATPGGAVYNYSGVGNVTVVDFACLAPANKTTMDAGADWQQIVHGLKESAAKDMNVVLKYIYWYVRDNIINQLIESPPPTDDHFIGNFNRVQYENIISVLDAGSMALSPIGLDAVFDGVTSIYCLSQGETSDALLYGTAVVAVGVSGGMVRGVLKGTDFMYISVKTGNLQIKPVTQLYCSLGGVGIKVNLKVSKKIFGQLASPASFNKLVSLKTQAGFDDFVKHLEDALDNTQLAAKLGESPKNVEDYFDYYRINKSAKSESQIISDFLTNLTLDLSKYAGKATKGIKNILNLESPVGLFRQLKGPSGDTYRAATFWSDEGAEIVHYLSSDNKYYIKHDPINGRVLFVDVESRKFVGFMLDQDNIVATNYVGLIENLKTIHGLPNGVRSINFNGTTITFPSDKATLLLGKYKPNSSVGVTGELGTDDIIEKMTILKNYSFADKSFEIKNGSIHILNIPSGNVESVENGWNTFFQDYNKEFLDLAIENKDQFKILFVSDPRKPQLLRTTTIIDGKFIPTGFAKEIKYLRERGIKSIYLKDGTAINLDIIDLNGLNWTGWQY